MGVPIRIHLFLVLVIAIMFGLEWDSESLNQNLFSGTAMCTVLVLIGSLIIHELGHAFALSNLGGHVNSLTFTPWGGDSDFVLPPNAYSKAAVFIAGPFVNLVIVVFGCVILIQTDVASFSKIVNPFAPHWFDSSNQGISILKIATWVNFQLLALNLLPCYPFDGAKIVRSLIEAANFKLPKYRLESAIQLIGNSVAFAFIGLAWICRDVNNSFLQPTWLPLVLIGITLLFAARFSLQQETTKPADDWEDMEDLDYGSMYNENSFFDFSKEPDNTAYSQWLAEKQESRRETELKQEEEEDHLADGILDKLHSDGLASLSAEEKAILDRVSERIRRRRQQGV